MVVIIHKGSHRVVMAHFLWSEALLRVPWVMKHYKQLESLQICICHRKNNHLCVTKRVGSHKRNPLKVETQMTGLME